MNILQSYFILKNVKSLNELPDEIPDEFCDPLMFSYIQQPVELPEGNIIMDKDVICRHLLTNEFDPFNRSKLTIYQC